MPQPRVLPVLGRVSSSGMAEMRRGPRKLPFARNAILGGRTGVQRSHAQVCAVRRQAQMAAGEVAVVIRQRGRW